MVQANPTSSVVVQRREQWTDGLLNAALFESEKAAMEVVVNSQCSQEGCQYCDVQHIPPRSQSRGRAVAGTIAGGNFKAPFLVTLTPEKL